MHSSDVMTAATLSEYKYSETDDDTAAGVYQEEKMKNWHLSNSIKL